MLALTANLILGLSVNAPKASARRQTYRDGDLKSICMPLLPPTAVDRTCTARMERLKAGNSNMLYKLERVCNPSGEVLDCHLIRVFGVSAALAMNREEENQIFQRLSSQGIAPPLVATFPGGRIEGWLKGRPCSAAECRTPAVYKPVARALAALHAFDAGGDNEERNETQTADQAWSWMVCDRWLAGARKNVADLMESDSGVSSSQSCSRLQALQARLALIDLEDLAAQLEQLEQLIRSRSPLPALCFCHNDLSNTNVHRDEEHGNVRLIDYEFGGRNYRGFDLVTHLSHWAGGAIDGRYDDDAFPSTAEVNAFLLEYADAAISITSQEKISSGSGASVKELAAALAIEVETCTPLVHCCWGLWALCSMPKPTEGSAEQPRFSHIEYAERRLRAFRTSLEKLVPPE